MLELARFDAKTLHQQASAQIAFMPSTLSSPFVQWHSNSGPDFDLEMSCTQAVDDSLHVALLASDFRLRFEKTYKLSSPKGKQATAALKGAYLVRAQDHGGYYLFFRNSVRAEQATTPVLALMRLDETGEIMWSNLYDFAHSDFEAEPRTCSDGSVLVEFVMLDDSKEKVLMKINTDGNVAWSLGSMNVIPAMEDFGHSSML